MKKIFLVILFLNITVFNCFAYNNKKDNNGKNILNTANTNTNNTENNDFFTLLFDYIKRNNNTNKNNANNNKTNSNTNNASAKNNNNNSVNNNSIYAFFDVLVQRIIFGNFKDAIEMLNKKGKESVRELDLSNSIFSNRMGTTILMYIAQFVCLQKDAAKLIKIISRYFIRVQYDTLCNTALIYAAIYNNVVFLKNCRHEECCIVKNRFGMTALMYAAIRCGSEFIELLLRRNRNFLGIRDNESRTALMYAVSYGNISAVRTILKYDIASRDQVEINSKDKYGNSVLFILIRILNEYLMSIRRTSGIKEQSSSIDRQINTSINRSSELDSRMNTLPIAVSDNSRFDSAYISNIGDSFSSISNTSIRSINDSLSVFNDLSVNNDSIVSFSSTNAVYNNYSNIFEINNIRLLFRSWPLNTDISVENYIYIIKLLLNTKLLIINKELVDFVIDNNLVEVFYIIYNYFDKNKLKINALYRKNNDRNLATSNLEINEIRVYLENILTYYLENGEFKKDEEEEDEKVKDKDNNEDGESKLILNNKNKKIRNINNNESEEAITITDRQFVIEAGEPSSNEDGIINDPINLEDAALNDQIIEDNDLNNNQEFIKVNEKNQNNEDKNENFSNKLKNI